MRERCCPVCRSEEVTLHMGGQLGTWRCKRCSYVGPIVLEVDDETR
ncbi:hypothetical protein J4439_04790 [Candidatus Woesearchaeota archaeon]|nr:hypothetical protein [Candidatus Woesearchaeota archaeon]